MATETQKTLWDEKKFHTQWIEHLKPEDTGWLVAKKCLPLLPGYEKCEEVGA